MKNKDYAVSLRMDGEDEKRMKAVCDYTKQVASDFMRVAIRKHIESEELRIIEEKTVRAEAEKRLAELEKG